MILYHTKFPKQSVFCFVLKLLCVFIYLFLAAPALRSYVRAFPVAVSRVHPLVVVQGLLIAMASLVAEHRL